MSDELNPYAPPEAGPDEPGRATKKKKKNRGRSGAIGEALARLNEHIDDASKVARDVSEAGGRLRLVTLIFTAIAAIALVGMLFALPKISSRDPAFFVSIAFTVIFAILAVTLVLVDLSIPPRDKPASPEATLKGFFKSMAMGRQGYAWACLSPTAREQTVEAPVLGDIPIGPGQFSLATPVGLKDYASTFIRVGHGQIRSAQIKRASIVEEEGDVAVVEVHAVFQAWPQWANIVAVVAFVLIRVVGAILFLVLFLALRKRHERTFRKTLLRGKNGLWYVYAGDLFDDETTR